MLAEQAVAVLGTARGSLRVFSVPDAYCIFFLTRGRFETAADVATSMASQLRARPRQVPTEDLVVVVEHFGDGGERTTETYDGTREGALLPRRVWNDSMRNAWLSAIVGLGHARITTNPHEPADSDADVDVDAVPVPSTSRAWTRRRVSRKRPSIVRR